MAGGGISGPTHRDDPGTTAVRVGLIGYGFSGRVFHAPVIAAARGVELAAIVSSRPDAVGRDHPGVRVVPDVDTLLEDPGIELVVVATPNTTHAELAGKSLRAGRHTVVEKPFVTRAVEAAPLIALAGERGLVLSAYHNRRWDGDFLTLRRVLEAGRVGEVVHFESHFDRFRPEIKAGWREEPREGSGVLFDLGSHLIDQALVLFGPPDSVWADVATQRGAGVVDDYFHLVLAWGRRRAILHGATLVRDAGPRFVVHGTEGSFTTWGLDPQEARLRADADGASPAEPPAAPTGRLVSGGREGAEAEEVPLVAGRYAAFYEELAAAVRGRGPNPVPPGEARDVIRVIEAAFRSAGEGRRVTAG